MQRGGQIKVSSHPDVRDFRHRDRGSSLQSDHHFESNPNPVCCLTAAVLLSYFSLRFQTTKMPNLVLEEPVWEARDAMLLLLPFFMSYLYEFNHSWITGGLWKAWLSPNCLQLGGGTSLTALGQYGLSSSFTQQDMKGIFHSSDVMCHSN